MVSSRLNHVTGQAELEVSQLCSHGRGWGQVEGYGGRSEHVLKNHLTKAMIVNNKKSYQRCLKSQGGTVKDLKKTISHDTFLEFLLCIL